MSNVLDVKNKYQNDIINVMLVFLLLTFSNFNTVKHINKILTQIKQVLGKITQSEYDLIYSAQACSKTNALKN